jgi:DNA-binding NtrC family response regulator
MKIRCPHCGKTISVSIGGRKPLNISVKNVCDTLRDCRDVPLAARKLGCSRAYIYTKLKKHGMTPREVLRKR